MTLLSDSLKIKLLLHRHQEADESATRLGSLIALAPPKSLK